MQRTTKRTKKTENGQPTLSLCRFSLLSTSRRKSWNSMFCSSSRRLFSASMVDSLAPSCLVCKIKCYNLHTCVASLGIERTPGTCTQVECVTDCPPLCLDQSVLSSSISKPTDPTDLFKVRMKEKGGKGGGREGGGRGRRIGPQNN